MLKKLCAAFLSFFMLCSMAVVPAAAEGSSDVSQAVYLGVQNYGTVTSSSKDTFVHRFWKDGTILEYQVSNANNYAVQNTLQEGYLYDLTVSEGTVTAAAMQTGDVAGTVTAIGSNSIQVDTAGASETVATDEKSAIYSISPAAGLVTVNEDTLSVGDTVRVFKTNDVADHIYKTFLAAPYTAPVNGTPGTKTLKNFLATALEPVGTALYIYGGTWDWQDMGSSNQATTIGISQSWIDFFQSQNANYTYKVMDSDGNSTDYAHSYYPNGEWNQYYYAGIDCSGYVGWALYNTMNTTSGGNGYVMGATGMAKSFAQTQNWGTWTQSFAAPTGHDGSDFHVGDIFSLNGHVWIRPSPPSIQALQSVPRSDGGRKVLYRRSNRSKRFLCKNIVSRTTFLPLLKPSYCTRCDLIRLHRFYWKRPSHRDTGLPRRFPVTLAAAALRLALHRTFGSPR